jgi:heme exporter protein A
LTPILEAQDLSVIRGDRLLFRQVSFALNAGELLLVEGANGSGKTSLMRVLAGLMDADSGEVRWHGTPTRRMRQEFRGQLLWYGHRSGCKQDLSPRENLRCETALRPGSGGGIAASLERLDILRLLDLPVRVLSAGQQRRVALARLLLSAAPLWLLDEPFTNLDAAGQDLVNTLVSEHLERGGLCVMASHRGLDAAVPQQRLTLS